MKNVVSQNAEGSAVIAANRARRWGQNSVQFYWDRLKEEPYDCQAAVYRGLPLFLKPCSFSPGKEHETTAEHARLAGGNLVVHSYPVFPPPSGWDMHAIDNKYPVFDEEDFFTGEKYQGYVYERGEQLERDARGKDIVVVASPHHICPPAFAD